MFCFDGKKFKFVFIFFAAAISAYFVLAGKFKHAKISPNIILSRIRENIAFQNIW